MTNSLAAIELIARGFEPNFKFTNEIRELYIKLIQWFHGDPDFPGDLNRGILLMGPTGTGKTLAMNVMLKYRNIDDIVFGNNGKWHKLIYKIVDVNEIKKTFIEKGYEAIETYCRVPCLCIDDLGYETISLRYGNLEDVIAYIIGQRYILKKLTLATTNLPLSELEKKYDDRTISRIYALFNFFEMIGPDFRKTNKYYFKNFKSQRYEK